MRVIGIIAEYNPFHNGHEYLIKKAKELVADPRALVMVVMSGPFTQRGEVSLLPKHVRAKQALSCGADIVLELPFTFACAPSERFAFGAVELLYRTGIVTDIAFGIDSGSYELLKNLSTIDFDSNPDYVSALKDNLEAGMSFPAARAKAIAATYPCDNTDELLDTLHSSNSILALDYLRAIRKLRKNFNVHAIQRVGSDYNDATISSEYPSATAIREICSANRGSITTLANSLNGKMPLPSLGAMLEGLSYKKYELPDNDEFMRDVLNRIPSNSDELTDIAYMSDNLNSYIVNTLSKVRGSSATYSEVMKTLNTKHFTMPRIMRAISSMLVNQKASFVEEAKHVPYVRVLGFSKDGRYGLKVMSKCCKFPILHNCSDYREIESTLDDVTKGVFELDMKANNYQAALLKMPHNVDWDTPPVIVK